MTERRERILKIAQNRVRKDAARISAKLAETKTLEYREFDLSDRIRTMLDYARLPAGTTGQRGTLNAATFLGRNLTQQLSASSERAAGLNAERQALETALTQALARDKILGDAAAQADAEARTERQEKAEAAREFRQKRP